MVKQQSDLPPAPKTIEYNQVPSLKDAHINQKPHERNSCFMAHSNPPPAEAFALNMMQLIR